MSSERDILLIEDDERVADILTRGLRSASFRVVHLADGHDGLALARSRQFAAILLDLMLPGMHGLDICQQLRAAGVQTPLLILSAADTPEARVKGLRMGADDYLGKPFDFEELLARIEALLRRSAPQSQGRVDVLRVGDLVFDRDRVQVHRGGQALSFTAKELALLELLMSTPGKTFTRAQILASLWGSASDAQTNVVDVYIRRLRGKIDEEGRRSLIRTVHGVGYRIEADREGGPGAGEPAGEAALQPRD